MRQKKRTKILLSLLLFPLIASCSASKIYYVSSIDLMKVWALNSEVGAEIHEPAQKYVGPAYTFGIVTSAKVHNGPSQSLEGTGARILSEMAMTAGLEAILLNGPYEIEETIDFRILSFINSYEETREGPSLYKSKVDISFIVEDAFTSEVFLKATSQGEYTMQTFGRGISRKPSASLRKGALGNASSKAIDTIISKLNTMHVAENTYE